MEKENEFFFWGVGWSFQSLQSVFLAFLPSGGGCCGGCGHSGGGSCGGCPRLTYIAPSPSFGELLAARSII